MSLNVASKGHALHAAAKKIVDQLNRSCLQVGRAAPDVNSFSIFDGVLVANRTELMLLAREHPQCSRAMGSIVGMAVCDAVGHAFEFLPVGEEGSKFDPETLEISGDFNFVMGLPTSDGLGKFTLKPGQWTDDTSMSLCMADSLLACGCFNGSDMRVRFWNWWNRGYNNAFRFDPSRAYSVGLGGNIAQSLADIRDTAPASRFEAEGEDAGNGSLMRLTPVPLYFHGDVDLAVAASAESSFTTHPGAIASNACAFLGFLLAQALALPDGHTETAADFLDRIIEAYLARPGVAGHLELVRLLRSSEPSHSTELCWNWREIDFTKLLRKTLLLRGNTYNGYPVSAGYFGAYSMDGLAMALNAFYHTTSFTDALTRIVNFRGDSDSTGAICGQIAGAFYGIDAIDTRLTAQLEQWDHGEIALRGALLYTMGDQLTEEDKACNKRKLECDFESSKRKRMKRPASFASKWLGILSKH